MMMRKNGSGRNNVGELERRNKNGSRLDTKTNKRLRKKESPETGYINSLHKTNTSSFTSINSAINESDVSGLNITLINSNSRMRSLAGNRSNTSSSLNGISKTANKIGKSKSKDILINQISTTNKPLKDLGPKVKQESGVTPNCDDYREQHKQDKNYISEKSLRSRTIISTNVPNSSFFLDNSVAQSPKSSSFSFSATSKMNSSNSKSSCDHRNKAMSTSVLPSSRKNRGRLSSSSSSHSVTRAATISNSSPMLTNESHGISTNSASQTKPHGDSGKTIVNGSSRLSSENISLLPSPETQPAVNQITPLSPIKPNTSQNSKKSSNINRCKTSAKNSSFNTTTSIQSIKSTNISSSSKNESPSKPNRNATKKPKGKRINKKKPNSAKKASLITPKQSNKKIDQRKVKKVKCNARIKKEPTNTKETDDESCNQIRRRGQRMASLNAICKVHLLFESERDMPIVSSNSVVSPTPPPSPTPTVKVAKSYSKTTPAKNAKKSQISKDDKKKKSDSKKKNDKKVNSAKKTTKKEPASKVKDLVLHDSKNKQVAVRRKRKLVDEDIEFIDTRSCKRMASLNASAMLAASALSERKVFKRSRSIESTRSTGSTVEIHETKISSSRKSRLQVPQNGGNTMHSCTADQVVVESAQTIELVKKVRRSSGKIRERLLAIEMMEREYNMVGKELKQTAIENGRKFIKSGLGEVTAKSVKKCRRSIQSTTTTREATTGLRRTTEYQVTKVQINTSEATDLSNEREKTAHQIETILNEDAIVQKYHIHHQTKASSQSYRVQMETSSFHPSSNPSANFITSSNAVHTVPCLPLYPSSNGPTVGDLHLANGANILQNNPLLTATNQGLNHNAAAAAAAAAACFSYPNQPSIVHVACNQPYRALTSSNSSINQINPIPVLNIGPQYPSHYASAFSVPNHSNHAASINYPTESYGFYQHSGPIIQPIHDPYIRAYSLHKPVPYHASQMAHHSDQTYREFNPIKRSSYSQQPQHPQQYTSTPHSHPSHTFPNPPPPHPLQSSMQKPQHPPLPSMSSHNPLSPMSNSPLTSPHQPSSQPQQLPPQSQQSVPGTSRFETNSFSSKAISYEQPSYYILQYPNNDISCSLRANNMYHNLSSTNDQITIHQSPHHDSQHLSVNIAVNNPTSFMGRDSMATTQAVQSNQRNLSSIQPISVPSTSSFSSSNGSTGGPSIAFLGSTSILPGHLTPSMFQTLASSSSSAANSIINPELPQGISPVPGPAPVAIATPVSVDNLTTLSSASPSNLVKEMASFNTNAISTQVGLPSTSNNNHTRSPSYESPNVNHQSNVAKISPLLTSSTNRFSKSVQCSTNTNPESKRSCHQQSSVSSTSQSNIIITPVNVTSSTNNHPSVNNVSNTSAFTHTANNTNAENLNGSNKQRLVTSSHQNNSLKDASVNSSYSDSSTTNMTRKLHRKQTEINNASVLNKHKSQSSRVRYPQAKTSPPSSKSSATISTTTPLTKSTATSTSPSNFNEPTLLKSTTGTSSSSTSPDQIVTSSDRSASNSHANGQLNSTKKRPTKSNKSLIDSNSVNESPTTTIVSSIEVGLARKAGKKKLFHGWSWRGNPSKKPVFIKPDEPPKLRDCYPAICHIQGDVIKVRDSVLLRGGPRKTDLHFVAKICALWEAPETGEMMMSLLWYYRPEHTEPGRKPHDQMDEIFASKHQDVNSVACIDDKCYVLTFNEYCRFRKIQKMESENLSHSLTETVVPTGKDYKRRGRIPMRKVFPDRVFFCRKVYDFRLGRTLKNPVSPVITDISVWRR